MRAREFILESADQDSIDEIIGSFVSSPVGQKYSKHDCKTVTRAFVQWADQNQIPTQVITLAPPSAAFIEKNGFQGKSGEGDGHIMPIVNGQAIDFTVRQFGVNRPFERPLVTPVSNLPSVYGRFGYFTDRPEWFLGGKTHWIGPLNQIPAEIFNQEFGDEILEQGVAAGISNAVTFFRGEPILSQQRLNQLKSSIGKPYPILRKEGSAANIGTYMSPDGNKATSFVKQALAGQGRGGAVTQIQVNPNSFSKGDGGIDEAVIITNIAGLVSDQAPNKNDPLRIQDRKQALLKYLGPAVKKYLNDPLLSDPKIVQSWYNPEFSQKNWNTIKSGKQAVTKPGESNIQERMMRILGPLAEKIRRDPEVINYFIAHNPGDWVEYNFRMNSDGSGTKVVDVKYYPPAKQGVAESTITKKMIHDLADRRGIAWDNEPNFLRMTEKLTGHKHLDDLDAEQLRQLYRHIKNKQGVKEGSNNVPSTLYHATYRPFLKSIKQHGLGGDNAQSKWEDSKPGVVYLALDPNVAESYAESSDMVPDEWLDQIIILKISTKGLENKIQIDKNVQDNEGDTLEYHGIIPLSNISMYKQGMAEGSQR